MPRLTLAWNLNSDAMASSGVVLSARDLLRILACFLVAVNEILTVGWYAMIEPTYV